VRLNLQNPCKNGLRNLPVNDNIPRDIKKILYSLEFERILVKLAKREKELFEQLQGQIEKIIKDPTIGKPLRYSLKNRRRVHLGSFVLVYEFHESELRFLDFDHHDKIYKSK